MTQNRPAILVTDVDFDHAILFQHTVSIWQSIDLSGTYAVVEHNAIIQSYSDIAVKVRSTVDPSYDEYYSREQCEFRLK